MMERTTKTQGHATTDAEHTSVRDLYGRFRAVESYQKLMATGTQMTGMAVAFGA